MKQRLNVFLLNCTLQKGGFYSQTNEYQEFHVSLWKSNPGQKLGLKIQSVGQDDEGAQQARWNRGSSRELKLQPFLDTVSVSGLVQKTVLVID